jgi:hypothetical protein
MRWKWDSVDARTKVAADAGRGGRRERRPIDSGRGELKAATAERLFPCLLFLSGQRRDNIIAATHGLPTLVRRPVTR